MYIYIYIYNYIQKIYIYTHKGMLAPLRSPLHSPPPLWCGGGCVEMRNENRIRKDLERSYKGITLKILQGL